MSGANRAVEFGVSVRPAPAHEDLDNIRQAEELGFDAAVFGDSQNAFPSPFVRMGAAATATSRIRLATCGVPAGTRHPAMVAGEAVTAHALSQGRVIVGLARGDSALSMIGREIPGPIDEFRDFATRVRAYLRGATVDCDGRPSRLTWLPKDLAPVPVDIAATGPRAIAMAAAIADRVSFAVGADPERVAWALEIARSAAVAAGRDPAEVRYGAFINIAVDSDEPRAAELMRNPIAYSAHFSAMKETRVADQPPALRRVTEPLRRAFITKECSPVDCVDVEFARWWGAIGDADQVSARLRALIDQGLTHFYLLNGSTAVPEFAEASLHRLANEVLPALRRAYP